MTNTVDWFIDADGLDVISIDGEYTYQQQVEQWVADNDYEIPTEPYRTMYTYHPNNHLDYCSTLHTDTAETGTRYNQLTRAIDSLTTWSQSRRSFQQTPNVD